MSTDASAEGRGRLDGSLLGGRYQLGELLGVGSSAAVFAALDVTAPDGSPPLAVKVLHAHLCQDRGSLSAFLGEGMAASVVRHPNVVGVHGWGTHEAGGLTVGWLALDRVDGGTLSDVVARTGRLAPRDAVEVMYGVLAGLEAVHQAGLVHRDVTPRNVLVAGADQEVARERVHVADLGLADVTGSTALVAHREVVGTPAYIAPEQVLGQALDARADLYQAGALLYFLLTGQPPYPRSTAETVVHAHLYAPPPVPSARVLDAAPLDRVVTRALAKHPSDRYQSAAEFRMALDEAFPATAPLITSAPPADATAVLPVTTQATSYVTTAVRTPARSHADRTRSDSRWGILAAIVIGMLVLIPVVQTMVPGAATAAVTATAVPSATSTAMGVVPLVSGTLQDATAALAAQGFAVGQVTSSPSSMAEGRLVSQHPEAGSLSPRGSTVDLVVASGRNTVPSVAGLSGAAASAQLKAAGFQVASTQLRSTSPVGGTSPAAGQIVRLGTTVTLLAATMASSSPAPTPSGPSDPPASTSGPTPTPSQSASASASSTRTPSASLSTGA